MYTDRREVLAGGNVLAQVWNSAKVKQAVAERSGAGEDLALGEVYEGFGSLVAYVLTAAEEDVGAVVRVPKVDAEVKTGRRVGEALMTAGVEGVLGMWAVLDEGNEDYRLTEMEFDETGMCSCGKAECECFPVEAIYVLQVLEKLPEGEPYLDVMLREEVTDEEAKRVYFEAGQLLGRMHARELELGENEERNWRAKALWHPIDGDERFGAIAEVIGQSDWFGEGAREAIDGKMRRVAQEQLAREVPVGRIHGDYWEGNWWYGKQGEVMTFDNALAVGYRGYDVGFAVGKQVIRYLVLGEEAARDKVEDFFDGYGSKEEQDEAKREMWNPLVFKLLVGAAFDKYDETVRGRLVGFAEAILDHKLNNPGAAAELQVLGEIWQSMA